MTTAVFGYPTAANVDSADCARRCGESRKMLGFSDAFMSSVPVAIASCHDHPYRQAHRFIPTSGRRRTIDFSRRQHRAIDRGARYRATNRQLLQHRAPHDFTKLRCAIWLRTGARRPSSSGRPRSPRSNIIATRVAAVTVWNKTNHGMVF